MRPSLRRFSQGLVFLVLVSVSAVLFQNCGSYMDGNNPLYDVASTSSCIGPTCSSEVDAVQLLIANQNPIQVKNPTTGYACNPSYCVDVAGYCDVAGFPDNAIFIELQGPTGFAEMKTNYRCDGNGRFRLLVQLPANYQHAQLHTLIVTLRVVDENGQFQNNPSGLHRKDINLIGVP